jgi:hypothetical protein
MVVTISLSLLALAGAVAAALWGARLGLWKCDVWECAEIKAASSRKPGRTVRNLMVMVSGRVTKIQGWYKLQQSHGLTAVRQTI